MGLLNKIKDILFEDEEVEEIEKKKDDKRVIKPQDKPIVEKVEPQKRNEFEDNTPPVREQPKQHFNLKKKKCIILLMKENYLNLKIHFHFLILMKKNFLHQ